MNLQLPKSKFYLAPPVKFYPLRERGILRRKP